MAGGLEAFRAQQEAIDVYDEVTGQAWLDYVEGDLNSQVDSLTAVLQEMMVNEEELAKRIAASSTAFTAREPKVLYAGATAIDIGWTLAGASIIAAWLKTSEVAQVNVKKVQGKLDQLIAEGKSQAQAMAEASPDFKQAFNEVYLHIIKTIATNSFPSAAGAATKLDPCAKAAINAVSLANDILPDAAYQLIGKKQGAKGQNLNADGDDYSDDGVYFGTSADGTFDVPLGTWDFLVFRDGYVRGNIEDLTFETCSVTVSTDVSFATVDEFFPKDLPPPSSDLLGACGDPAANLICQNLYGLEQSKSAFMDACSTTWFDTGCPSANAMGGCSFGEGYAMQQYVQYNDPDEANPAEAMTKARDNCLAISPEAGGPGVWVSPYLGPA